MITLIRGMVGKIKEIRKSNEPINVIYIGLSAGLFGALAHSMVEPSLRGAIFQILFWLLMGIFLKQVGASYAKGDESFPFIEMSRNV